MTGVLGWLMQSGVLGGPRRVLGWLRGCGEGDRAWGWVALLEVTGGVLGGLGVLGVADGV